jgi:adenylosuccinate lyase
VKDILILRGTKGLTRTNEAITKKSIHEFIGTLEVSETIKSELLQITQVTS